MCEEVTVTVVVEAAPPGAMPWRREQLALPFEMFNPQHKEGSNMSEMNTETVHAHTRALVNGPGTHARKRGRKDSTKSTRRIAMAVADVADYAARLDSVEPDDRDYTRWRAGLHAAVLTGHRELMSVFPRLTKCVLALLAAMDARTEEDGDRYGSGPTPAQVAAIEVFRDAWAVRDWPTAAAVKEMDYQAARRRPA
jgi:hypothetical protein